MISVGEQASQNDVSCSGFNQDLFITSAAAHIQGDLCDLFAYLWCFVAAGGFTSSVPAAAVILGHSQQDISNPQDDAVNKVPRERSAVPNHFNPVSGLEPGSPAAPGGPVIVSVLMATFPIMSDV